MEIAPNEERSEEGEDEEKNEKGEERVAGR
jgi:hypothetical protein